MFNDSPTIKTFRKHALKECLPETWLQEFQYVWNSHSQKAVEASIPGPFKAELSSLLFNEGIKWWFRGREIGLRVRSAMVLMKWLLTKGHGPEILTLIFFADAGWLAEFVFYFKYPVSAVFIFLVFMTWINTRIALWDWIANFNS